MASTLPDCVVVIGLMRTNFSEISIKIQQFAYRKMILKMPSAKRWPFCPKNNELTEHSLISLWHTRLAYCSCLGEVQISKVCSQWSNKQQVNISSDDGMVPSGNRHFCESIITKIEWRHIYCLMAPIIWQKGFGIYPSPPWLYLCSEFKGNISQNLFLVAPSPRTCQIS